MMKRIMIKQILLTVMSIGLLSTLGGLSGLTVFTDTASVDSNTFTTGSITITTTPSTALVTFSDMAPGELHSTERGHPRHQR